MLEQEFYEAVDTLQETIRNTQSQVMKEAAQACVEAVAKGRTIHLFDTGHLVDMELKNRAGGFTFIQEFKYNIAVTNPARVMPELESTKDRNNEGLAKYALNASNVYAGDVMFIGSVSGNSINVIDLALEAKKMGVTVIGMSSLTYSKQLGTIHSSGKKLYDIADIMLDNCAPYGDGMLDVEGIDQPFIPASGIGAVYIMWSIMAQILEGLLAKGITPGVLGSVNKPSNVESNERLYEQYKKRGY